MQKTEDHVGLLHLSATGKGFCVAVSLLIFAATFVSAAEPAMSLTLADPRPALMESNAVLAADWLAVSGNSVFDFKSSSPAAASSEKEPASDFSRQFRLEQPAQFGQRDLFQLVRNNRIAASRSNTTFSVQAGYERIWDEKSMLSKLSSGHQEVGCAYVRAKISF